MTNYEAELQRLNSPKQKLLSLFPAPAIYARYLKGLFRGEIELRLLPLLCDPALASIDVGAHQGIYSLGMSLYSRRVIAVEPQHARAEALRASLPARATVIEGALSKEAGTATLQIPLHDWDSTSRLDSVAADATQWRSERVALMRMDDIARERVGFVKVDVEGHEREVLEGASALIKSDKPAFLIEVEERHRAGSVGDVIRLMTEHGYRGYFVEGSTIRPIDAFEIERHQRLSLVGVGDRMSYRDYINNFIFLRPDVVLPQTVPSAWQGLRSSLGQLAAGGR